MISFVLTAIYAEKERERDRERQTERERERERDTSAEHALFHHHALHVHDMYVMPRCIYM